MDVNLDVLHAFEFQYETNNGYYLAWNNNKACMFFQTVQKVLCAT